MSRPTGLREVKRRATIELVERVAITLAIERGHEHVTVEAICQQAGIARSTFFNYFPSRESSIFGRGLTIVDAETGFAILDSTAPDLLRGIFAVGVASAADDAVNPEINALRQRLFAEQPSAFRSIVQAIGDTQFQLTTLVAAWLAAHPEHAKLAPERSADEAALAVGACTTAALRMNAGATASSEPIPFDEAEFRSLLDDIRTVLGPPSR